MNSYTTDYIVHNLPLLFLSGLEPENTPDTPAGDAQTFLGDGGFRIRSELPPLHHSLSQDLRSILLSYDRSEASWRPQSMEKPEQTHAFKIRSVGRAFTFPPRKAPPPPHSPRLRPAGGISPPPLTLHSTLSPLSPSSPLYPDGIFTSLWITKHQHRLPSVLVSFYSLVSDSNTSSLEDNKIKSEVNNLRSLITSTNYKTRFVIVLVADGPIGHTDLEDRLVNIRRGTNFDSKGLYFLPSTSSRYEVNDFAKVLLSTLYPTSIEYYRDLSKHARRKRNRNVVPQPTIPPTQGTSSVLSSQGWNVRYEFKLAVFAEQRQEMDAACRNYETAYDSMFSGELVESIAAWSSRFNEARMIADVIAIRIIRCLLWSSQSTAAVKWWIKHKNRMQDLVDRRGKGTKTYGWHAWCGIWSKTMAESITRAELFSITAQRLGTIDLLPIHLIPDRDTTAPERQGPWEYLHHEGYWLSNVAKYIDARRKSAVQIPPEDRNIGRGNNPVTAKRAHLYENYLVPEPAQESTLLEIPEVGYTKRISEALEQSIQIFQSRSQRHTVEVLQQRLQMETVSANAWPLAMQKLNLMWSESSWRHQGWWNLLAQTGDLLLRTAIELEDYEMCLRLSWELAGLQSQDRIRNLKLPSPDPISTAVDLGICLPQLTPGFAFALDTGHVGENVALQLSLTCSVDALPLGLQISELKIVFDGGINPVLITNSNALTGGEHDNTIGMMDIILSEADSDSMKESKRLSRLSTTSPTLFTGQANLTFSKQGTKVLNLDVVPREAGQVSVSSIVLLVANETHQVALDARDLGSGTGSWWELRGGLPVMRTFGCQRDVTMLTVLPKPPKVEVKMLNLAKAYYTNEIVEIRFELVNAEGETIHADLDARLISPARHNVEIAWKHERKSVKLDNGETREAVLSTVKIQELVSLDTQPYSVLISGLDESVDHELEIKVSYTLATDSSNPLVKQTTIDIPVVRPFEASIAFHPRHHKETWPDFFSAPVTENGENASGLKQLYLAQTEIGCFAHDPLRIRSLELKPLRIVGGTICDASPGKLLSKSSGAAVIDPTEGVQVLSDKTERFVFDVELQKMVLGDRSPVAVDCAININWSRDGSDAVNTSTLPLTKFLAPMSEPRVLLQATDVGGEPRTHLLTYTIENPSMHFLTFNVTMTGGEDIAFSGPKVKTVSLVPISRYNVQYRVFTQKKNEWVKVLNQIVDAVFQQHLKVQPVSDNITIDKQGIVQLRIED